MKLRKDYLMTVILIAGGAVLGALIALSVKDKTPVAVTDSGVTKSALRGKTLAPEYYYDIEKYKGIEPKLFKWKEMQEVKTGLKKVYGVSVSPDGRLAVCGENGIEVYSGGKLQETIQMEEPVTCVYFDNNIIFGTREGVGIYADGKKAWIFGPPARGKGPQLKYVSSVAASEGRIFIADAVAKKIYVYLNESKQLTEIKGNKRFIIPSPHFDAAVKEGALYVNNPGEHRIEKYSFDGKFLRGFGRPGMDVEGFSGCCNPTNILVLKDGRIVTSEKGLPRIKIFSAEGKLLEVVAGPKDFSENCVFMDLAVDGKGRIYALDSFRKSVRIFERK
ncbi:MAG: hypothetical protein WCI43_01955 [Candidatus Firestonebacteria bacterium]